MLDWSGRATSESIPKWTTSVASTTRSPASVHKRFPQNWSAINASSRSPNSGNCSQRPLHMFYEQGIVHKLYKKLLTLYPQAFKEQLGESMEQTFNDLCNEQKEQAEYRGSGFVLWIFIETALGIIREHVLL